MCVCPVWVQSSPASTLRHKPFHHHTTCFVQPPFTPLGAVQPLQGLTKILRALTFAGHLAHPHQSVEVALCSICDTWKHGSIGQHQIKGAELKSPLLQLCNPPLKVPTRPIVVRVGTGNKALQAEMETRQEKSSMEAATEKRWSEGGALQARCVEKKNLALQTTVPATTPGDDYITMTRWSSWTWPVWRS